MPSSSPPALPSDPYEVWIHADESCLGNQFMDRANPGGGAGLVEFWNGADWVRRDYWISEPATTNNRMAIRSAIEGLRGLSRPCAVLFVSDSQYLVNGMTRWLADWESRGWKRKAGPIENVELWRELLEESRRHRVTWSWVRGHAGHPRNEYANDLAVRAAKAQDRSNGLQESGFPTWLEAQRKKGRYLDFAESAVPPGMAG